jgi:hypothetical protein
MKVRLSGRQRRLIIGRAALVQNILHLEPRMSMHHCPTLIVESTSQYLARFISKLTAEFALLKFSIV